MSQAHTRQAPARQGPLARHVLAVTAGNALEFYDFLTYSFFAVAIGKTFFPSGDPVTSLLGSLATFGVGFATRPLGAIVLGILGDRAGRKQAMYLSFTLMGVGMAGVTLTPSYASIGIAAPVLLIVFRLVQGFALGGEVGPATAFLIEAPPAGQRGFYGSLQSASQYVATFCTGLIATGLAMALPADVMADWGWRIAFGLGVLIIPFGLLIRRSLPETLHGAHGPAAEAAAWRDHWGDALLGLLMMGGATIATYVVLSLATYSQATLHLAPVWAFGATMAVGAGGSIGAPLGGYLSDRIGRRKPIILAGLILLALFAIPSFQALSVTRSGPLVVGTALFLAFAVALNAGVAIMSISELLPPSIRSGAMSTIYAVAIAVFGGSAQYISAYLTERVLHDPVAPAYYLTAAVLVAMGAALALRETAPAHLRHGAR